jgi:hypothetical protein
LYQEGVSEIKKGLALIVLPVILFGLSWHGTVFGVGALFTQLAGKEAAVEARTSKRYSASRRFCDYRLVPELASPIGVELCMTAEQFGQLQSGATVRLLGRESRLGLHIREWQPANRSVETDTQKLGTTRLADAQAPCGAKPLHAAHFQR